MIAVRLMGGLGNQLFQYAAGRALALARGAELLLDHGWFDDVGDATPRSYALIGYALAARRFEPERLRADVGWLARVTKRHAAPSELLRAAGWRVVRPAGRRCDLSVFVGDKLYLDGYWQSAGYFDSARDALLAELTLLQPPEGENAAMLARIEGSAAVAVHVRRGDYVSDPRALAHHGLCSLDYYRDAFAYVQQHIPEARPFVFSDDMQWARAQLGDWPGVCFVDHNDDAQQDLQLMRHCRHFIIANSSFSWWGAWLAQGADKIVVAPRRWFADPAADEGDLVPAEWVRR